MVEFLKILGILSVVGGLIGAWTARGYIEIAAIYIAAGVTGFAIFAGLGVIINLLEDISAALAPKSTKALMPPPSAVGQGTSTRATKQPERVGCPECGRDVPSWRDKCTFCGAELTAMKRASTYDEFTRGTR